MAETVNIKRGIKILIISLKGIGDTVHALPMLKVLTAKYPEAEITVIVPNAACRALLGTVKSIKNILVIDYTKPSGIIGHLVTLLKLRFKKFDFSITTFPSNRIWYNIFAFAVGAKKRITHAYPAGRLKTLAFLQNIKVPADPSLHTVEQNMNLLAAMGISSAEIKPFAPCLTLPPEDESFARQYLEDKKISGQCPLVGLHPSFVPGTVYKAWSSDNIEVFALLADWLHDNYNAQVMIFGSSDEGDAVRKIHIMSKYKPLTPVLDILKVAALIKRCKLFINTDSGLGHIAAALGIPTITIFGPANPAMTKPYCGNNILIKKNLPCSPCYDYPYYCCKPDVKCGKFLCFSKMDIDEIKDAVRKQIGAA